MVKINMMCGKRNFGAEWFHVDGDVTFPHIGSHDIMLATWPDNTIDLIYCGHGIAYFDRQEFALLLHSWFMKLTPGGKIELATPDMGALIEAYWQNDLDTVLGPLYGRMQMNGTVVYHKTVWDLQSLTNVLVKAGFVNTDIYDHTATCHPNTGNREDFYDDHSAAYIGDTLISLNVQATKPIDMPIGLNVHGAETYKKTIT